jgi:hypothetical protein
VEEAENTGKGRLMETQSFEIDVEDYYKAYGLAQACGLAH